MKKGDSKKGASRGKSEDAPEVSDPRFTSMYSAPIFKKNRKEDNKVKLDDRFGSVLTDKRFRSAPGAVDKYGRKSKQASTKAAKQELEQFYSIEGHDDDDATKTKNKKESKGKPKVESRLDYLNKLSRGEISGSESSISGDDGDSDEKGSDDEGSQDSDTDGNSVSVAHEVSEEVFSDEEEAPTGDSSFRLAIQSIDWDNMTAEDIMVVMQSFCPTGRTILKVTVYPSDYGKEQMKLEAEFGPAFLSKDEKEEEDEEESSDGEDEIYDALVGDEADKSSDNDDRVDGKSKGSGKGSTMKGADFHRKGNVVGLVMQEELVKRGKADKSTLDNQDDRDSNSGPSTGAAESGGVNAVALRKYELNKLKYYFAVAECDSVQTADLVYKELDGMEFENSSMIFDLRFVPDEVEFEGRDIRDSTTSTSIAPTYKPPEFVVQALQHTNVECTWDEGDRERGRKLGQSFGKWKDLNESELQQYLASDSEDSDKEEDGAEERPQRGSVKKKVRQLLLGDDNGDDDDDEDGEDDFFMDAGGEEEDDADLDKEYSFVPSGAGINTQDDAPSDETPFEKTMRRMSEKKKAKKLGSKAKKAGMTPEEYIRSKQGADGEYDMYVDGTGTGTAPGEHKEPREKSKKKKEAVLNIVVTKSAASKEELGLMFGDGEEEDFDMRGLVKAQKEKEKKGKKTKSRKKAENSASDGAQESQEGFAVDVKDDRFSRMMEGDARFGIDPLAPEFKDTDAMRTIMGEQKKRRKKSEKGRKTKREGGIDENEDRDADQGATVDISALKDRLKRRKQQ